MTKNIKEKCKEICSTCVNTKCKCKDCIASGNSRPCWACGLKLSVSAFIRCREEAGEKKKNETLSTGLRNILG